MPCGGCMLSKGAQQKGGDLGSRNKKLGGQTVDIFSKGIAPSPALSRVQYRAQNAAKRVDFSDHLSSAVKTRAWFGDWSIIHDQLICWYPGTRSILWWATVNVQDS